MPIPLKEVIELSVQAGLACLRHYRAEGIEVKVKSDNTPLSAADLASHACIVDGLAMLSPEFPLISEEGSDRTAPPTGRWWLIDPLDGTKEFLSGNGQFTVNIALMEGDRPLWGVVHVPVLGVTYWGGGTQLRDSPAHSGGAWRRRSGTVEPIHTAPSPGSSPGAGAAWRVVASRSHMDDGTRRLIDSLPSATLSQAGSSLKFCRVAEGEAHLYPRLAPTCEWDTAAAQAVLEGAGGSVTAIDGLPLRYGKPGFRNPWFTASGASVLEECIRLELAAIVASGS